MIPVFSWGLQRRAEGPEVRRLKFSLPPSRCLWGTMGRGGTEKKMLQNQIRKAVWAGWRVFVQERGFISGKHSQEFRFGIVHPIPAFHRKPCIKSNWKTPEDISFVRQSTHREHQELKPRGFLLFQPSKLLKKKLAAWKTPLIHRSGGSCPWRPLSLRAHTHLMTPDCDGKINLHIITHKHVQTWGTLYNCVCFRFIYVFI